MVVSKIGPIQKGKKPPTATVGAVQSRGGHGSLPLSLGVIIPELPGYGKREFLIFLRFSVLHKIPPEEAGDFVAAPKSPSPYTSRRKASTAATLTAMTAAEAHSSSQPAARSRRDRGAGAAGASTASDSRDSP